MSYKGSFSPLPATAWLHFNPFPNKPCFLRVCSISLLKTLWEKEKLLITSNFSFSHSVFYPFEDLSASFIKVKKCCLKVFRFGRVYNLLFRKGLIYLTHRNPRTLIRKLLKFSIKINLLCLLIVMDRVAGVRLLNASKSLSLYIWSICEWRISCTSC